LTGHFQPLWMGDSDVLMKQSVRTTSALSTTTSAGLAPRRNNSWEPSPLLTMRCQWTSLSSCHRAI